jgi:hypothetical protein
MARTAGGADPTRKGPGGSRTETKISEASELGSDRAGGGDPADRDEAAQVDDGGPTTVSGQGSGSHGLQRKREDGS